MMLSFISARNVIVRSISCVSPMETVIGLWIINIPKGEISMVDPAIATTDAAEAAIPSIFTATFPLYSMSIL